MCRSEQVFSPPRCVPGSTSCLPRHTTTATSDVVPVCAVRVAKHAGPCHKSYLSLNTRFGVVLAERERCVGRGLSLLPPLLHFLSSTPSHSLAGWPAGRLINNIKKSYPAAAPALKKSLRGGGRWLGWIGCRGGRAGYAGSCRTNYARAEIWRCLRQVTRFRFHNGVCACLCLVTPQRTGASSSHVCRAMMEGRESVWGWVVMVGGRGLLRIACRKRRKEYKV